jgi:hypothetical protein
MEFTNYYSIAFIGSYLSVIIPTLLVIISAVLSAKSMGGTLGQGLKKIAAGSIVHTILIMTYILLERGNQGVLNELEVRIFFITSAFIACILLISGYIQVYRISKKLRLFTN